MLECGIHSAEWITPVFCLYVIQKLIDTNLEGPLQHFNFYILPMLNPDGYLYSWSNYRLWRKNRRPHNCSATDIPPMMNRGWARNLQHLNDIDGTACYGVDLNRNFNISFGTYEEEEEKAASFWSPTYHGPDAFSEPETQAVNSAFDWIADKYEDSR